MKNQVMIVNKIGNEHLRKAINNQDYYFVSEKVKMVFDGCSGSKNAEVGVKLFSSLFSQLPIKQIEDIALFEKNVDFIFQKILSLSNDITFIFDHLCFTIVAVFETEKEFVIKYAGDGYVITQKNEQIEYIKLENGCENNYPKYAIYNYIEPEYLMDYKNGVPFYTLTFLKEKYENIGVATDGLFFSEKLDWKEQQLLKQHILNRKKGKIDILINRNQIHFHDDITICF